MNTADTDRMLRVVRALDRALGIFRKSATRATVGDIEAERKLSSLRDELHALLVVDTPRQKR
jgi:hypothetical protein